MKTKYPMAVVTSPGRIELQERSLPEIGPEDVLIRVKACAICGSDLHIFKGAHPFAPPPVAIGHELSGQVIQTGDHVTRVREGDRVAVEPLVVCGECHFCRRGQYHRCVNISFQYRIGQGGFTHYFVADQNWTHPIPEGLSYREGALLEPLSVAMHAVRRGRLQVGHDMAIFGDGSVGQMILMIGRKSGAGKIFLAGVNEFRMQIARKLGASAVIHNLEENALQVIRHETDQLGVDRSFEAVGLQSTLIQSLQALKKGGRAVLAGLFEHEEATLPVNLFVQREITLAGTQGYHWDFQRVIQLLKQHELPLSDIISHEFPLSAIQDAFELLADPDEPAMKVVIRVE